VLEEGFVCGLFIELLGTLLFSVASVVLIARAIVRAGLYRGASWIKAVSGKAAALHHQQPEQPLTGRRRELIAGHIKRA
jgi:hypothetical protein